MKTSKVFDKSRSATRVDSIETTAAAAASSAAAGMLSDQSRYLAVEQLAMCAESRLLAVAGAGGHVILFKVSLSLSINPVSPLNASPELVQPNLTSIISFVTISKLATTTF